MALQTEVAPTVTAPAPVAAQETVIPSPAEAAERVISLIPNATLKSGFMGLAGKPYTLVLTDRRVIFAFITKQMMKDMVEGARSEAKAEGKGFFGQWGAQLGAYSKFAQRYFEMTPEQSLSETPENFAVERTAIKKAKVKVGRTDENGASSIDELVIKTADKKYVLLLGAGSAQAKKALIEAALI